MRRRTLLATVAGGAAAVAGCLADDGDATDGTGDDPGGDGSEDNADTGVDGDQDGDPDGSDDGPGGDDPEDRRYEECSREVIPYEQFPEDVRAEIDAALDGTYEAERVYLREAMDVEESYVSVDGEYYRASVAVGEGGETLTLDRVVPKALPDPRPVAVEHGLDGERTITVEVVAEDGTVLIDETREQRAGGEVEYGRTARVGTHDLHLTVERDGEVEVAATRSVRIDESRFSVIAIVEVDEVVLTGAVAELGECRFDPEE